MTLSSSEILKDAGYGSISNRLIREWTAHHGDNIFLYVDDERVILRILCVALLLLLFGAVLVGTIQSLDSPIFNGSALSWEPVLFAFAYVALAITVSVFIGNAFHLVQRLLSYRNSAKAGRIFREDYSNFLALFGEFEPYAMAEWAELQNLARRVLAQKAKDYDTAEVSYRSGSGTSKHEQALEEFEEAFELLCRFRLIEFIEGRSPFFKEIRENGKVNLTTVPSP
ncbi:MAG: hypothetical protein JKX80_00035 [Candidatus Pacebacteria bacterium]|nr:hypothetical protein [Candidatus Paceibacterota bacterium]